MKATYHWEIKSIKCYPLAQGNENVVFSVDWACIAMQDNASAYCYGSCGIAYTSTKFTPYNKLTNDEMVKWLWVNGIDKDEIESNLQGEINAKLSPKHIEMPLPWEN
jgi:hypothetical protein